MALRALLGSALWILSAAVASAESPAPNPEHPGASLFRALCAECHGTSAGGKEGEPDVIDPAPDLTRLADRNEELLRLATLIRVIDGRRTVRAHGAGKMPVWGDELVADVPDNEMRERARIRLVQSLAEYLLTIQVDASTSPSP